MRIRLRRGRARFEALRRRRAGTTAGLARTLALCLTVLTGIHVPGDPLVTPVDLVPVAGHPLAVGRRLAPDAADPEVVVARDVPAPVARDPLDVLAGRLLVGRHLLDRVGRLLGDDRSRRRVVNHRRGERLVDRAAGQDLPALGIGLVSGRSLRALRIGPVGDRGRSRGRVLSACRPAPRADGPRQNQRHQYEVATPRARNEIRGVVTLSPP